MAINFQHYMFTFHPIKLHIFLSKLHVFNKFLNFGCTLHCYSHVSEASHSHEQTLNIADKARCVPDIFCGIHEILLLFNKIKKKKTTEKLMIQAGLDFH